MGFFHGDEVVRVKGGHKEGLWGLMRHWGLGRMGELAFRSFASIGEGQSLKLSLLVVKGREGKSRGLERKKGGSFYKKNKDFNENK